jgi:hypothetical protein
MRTFLIGGQFAHEGHSHRRAVLTCGLCAYAGLSHRLTVRTCEICAHEGVVKSRVLLPETEIPRTPYVTVIARPLEGHLVSALEQPVVPQSQRQQMTTFPILGP